MYRTDDSRRETMEMKKILATVNSHYWQRSKLRGFGMNARARHAVRFDRVDVWRWRDQILGDVVVRSQKYIMASVNHTRPICPCVSAVSLFIRAVALNPKTIDTCTMASVCDM